MARLLFPDEGSRLAYRVSGNALLRAIDGAPVTLYLDQAATQLADLRSYDGTQTPGPVIPGSVVTTDAYSRLPLFWGPDALVDTLWAVIYGGPVSPVFSRFDPRIDALEVLANAALPAGTVVYDVFTGAVDAPSIAGRVPVTGPVWLNTGAQGVGLVSGFAVSTGTGYMYGAGNPDVLACGVAFAGPVTGQPMTMAWSSSVTMDVLNLMHFNFGPTGFNVTARQDGVSFDTIFTGSWDHACETDGTVYHFSCGIEGQRLVIYGPNGETFASPNDPRVAALRGTFYFWEPNTVGASIAKVQTVSAYTYTSPTLEGFTREPQIGSLAAGVTPNSVLGGPAKRWQVSTGYEPTQRMPAVVFGAALILTRLVGAQIIGATSIITEYPIPTGSSTKIETGNGAEVVTTNASPTGTGPYTSSISTPLTKNHANGVAAAATTPTNAKAFMYLNTENGNFFLPNASITVLGTSFFYWPGLTLSLNQSVAGVLNVGGTGNGKGAVRTGQVTTAARPAANSVGVGAQLYDTTLSKPIWSDGATWRDAAGTAV